MQIERITVDTNLESRGRRQFKNALPEELSRDVDLTVQDEVRRSIREFVYRFTLEL